MIVLRFCHRPPTARRARELQDVLVTLAAFGMPLTLIFSGAGAELLDRRMNNDVELLAMLPGMGVGTVLLEAGEADSPALAEANAVLPFQIVKPDQVRDLLARARHTVNL